MSKTDSIARRILGWKLNRWDRWYDFEHRLFIHESDFQPEHNLDHAMIIVNRLEQFGYKYTTDGVSEVAFNDVRGSGKTLSQAITNAAYSIIEHHSIANSTGLWQKLS
ncbi:BC1872 family protein [Neobacillus sp. D3-1R]|uniref:BC1872 family protein n=1 Tax=Neobacillus sp. D3-1R TaxID=3445778 RepID=UPI003FA023B3